MATEVKTIRVVLDAKGDARQVLTGLQSIKQSIQDVGKEVNGFAKFRDIFASLFAFNVLGMGVSGLANIADSLTMVRERLKAFNGDSELTETIMNKLQKTARDVRQPIDDISASFARISVATEKYKMSTDAQIALTQVLAQTFKLSGASSEEAAGGMTQITQAMSRGVLRGQELVSVMSNNSVLANLLSNAAKAAGKNIYEMGEKGEITGKFFFNVLAKNFDSINEKAKNTKGTFQQGVTLAMNEFKTAVDKVNTSLDLSNNFYKFMSFLVDNKEVIISAIVGIGTAISASLIGPIVAAGTAIKAFFVANPIAAAVVALTAAVTYFILNIEKIVAYLDRFAIAADMAFIKLGMSITSARIAITDFFNLNSQGLKNYQTVQEAALKKVQDRYDASVKKFEEMGKAQEQVVSGADKIKEAADDIADAVIPLETQIANLNKAYNRGSIGVETYNSKLLVLQRLLLNDQVFVKGAKSIEDLDKEMAKNTLDAYARSFERGAISLETFNKKVNDFKIDELNRKFLSGKISVDDYRISLAELSKDLGIVDGAILGFQTGLIKTNKTMGDWVSGVSGATESAFGSFEDAIFNASKGATDAWANMTQAILDDITRLVIRMAIVKPLVNAFMGVDWGGPQEAGSTASVSSGGVGQRMQAFASGGIVSSPTYFGSASKMGVMGEAGPEAIMPLTKMSDGSLGVSAAASNTIVNIINQSGSEVSQTESTGANGEKIIDVLIMSKVREGISSGMFDKAFSQNYGLRRRGV